MSAAFLLDTHTLLWWAHEPAALSRRAFDLISQADNRMFVSAVSAMEIATKSRRGRLEYDTLLSSDFVGQTAARGLEALPVSCEHAQLAGNFEAAHADPWDRLLAAQARVERLTLVTCDARMAGFGVETLW